MPYWKTKTLHDVGGTSAICMDADYDGELGLALLLAEKQELVVEIPSANSRWPFPQAEESYIESSPESKGRFIPWFLRWLPGSRLLLAPARSEERAPVDADWAWIVDLGGRPLQRLMLGDGIENIQVTAGGEIWVGYFDEGVYGLSPLGSEGLIKFGVGGTPVFRYHTDLKDRPIIDDCYATCLDKDDGLWLFAYSSFELVHLSPGGEIVARHRTPERLHGARALQVFGTEFAVFVEPYDFRGTAMVWAIGSDRIESLGPVEAGSHVPMKPDTEMAFLHVAERRVAEVRIDVSGS